MSALRSDDDGRAALAAAIARHAAAVEALERVREAASRAPDVWEARHAVEAAEAALGEARAGEAGHLVRQLMSSSAPMQPISGFTRQAFPCLLASTAPGKAMRLVDPEIEAAWLTRSPRLVYCCQRWKDF